MKKLTAKKVKDYMAWRTDERFTHCPIAIAIAGAIASDINNGRVNFLKWDRQERIYYPVKCNIYGRAA